MRFTPGTAPRPREISRANRLAFEALYELHQPGILSFCRQILRSEHDAEDAAQQTFLSACEHLLAGKRPAHPRAWLYAIARNYCLMTLRRRRRAEGTQVLPQTRELVEEIEKRFDFGHLVTDLLDLPEDQRLALVLFELGDLSHTHIAEILGCKPSKVKSLVFQARGALLADRQAWQTPCREIREQVVAERGPALRGRTLRRHIRHCRGCAAFYLEVRRRRQAFRIAVPAMPALGLKQMLLAALALTRQSGGLAPGAAAMPLPSATIKLLVLAIAATGVTLGHPVATSPKGYVSAARSSAGLGDGRGFPPAPAWPRRPRVDRSSPRLKRSSMGAPASVLSPPRRSNAERLARPAMVVEDNPPRGPDTGSRKPGRKASVPRRARRNGHRSERTPAAHGRRDQLFPGVRDQKPGREARPREPGSSAPRKAGERPSSLPPELLSPPRPASGGQGLEPSRKANGPYGVRSRLPASIRSGVVKPSVNVE